MPEVMPCPASMNDGELLKLKHRFDDVCQSSTTPELFELCRAGSHLVDALLALTWTHEPPKVAGWYWEKIDGDWFIPVRQVTVGDLMDGGFEKKANRQWAGPIRMPKEA